MVTSPPKDSVYSGVVTLRSLRLCMLLGELNGLDVDAADVGNAYLMAYTKEKLFIIAGPEFGDLQGCLLIIVKSLYVDFGLVEPDGMNSLLILSWIWDSILARQILMFG
jgi:hypothetical protein